MSAFSNPASSSREDGAAYTAALLDLLGDRDPLEVWRALPDAIDRLTADVSPDQARMPEREGKWSMTQVVAHLVDSEIVYAYRVRLTVAQDTPEILGYDQDAWSARLGYDAEDLTELRQLLRLLRGRNLRLIEPLDDAALDRCCVHNERGHESVRQMVRLLAAHDLVHRNQIQRIRTAIGLP